jgi:endonuclease YncB( thermonuclease family)
MLRLILIVSMLAFPAFADDSPVVGKVHVTDGDTLRIAFRLFGIDTPESDQRCRNASGSCYDCGETSTEALKAMTGDKTNIRCERTGASTWGRPVAICYDGDTDLNLEMLKQGHAVAYRRYLDGVPGKRRPYIAAEEEAKAAGRGIWAGDFIPPHKWRNGERLDGCE